MSNQHPKSYFTTNFCFHFSFTFFIQIQFELSSNDIKTSSLKGFTITQSILTSRCQNSTDSILCFLSTQESFLRISWLHFLWWRKGPQEKYVDESVCLSQTFKIKWNQTESFLWEPQGFDMCLPCPCLPVRYLENSWSFSLFKSSVGWLNMSSVW